MRKALLAILMSLLPVAALGQGTIDDLDAASSLSTSDMLACAQGTTVTKKCSLEQVKDWLITYFDTEEEFEAILTDVANMIVSTEIDMEAELEALLSDVSNMLVSTELDTEDELEALLGDVTDVYTDSDGTLGDMEKSTYDSGDDGQVDSANATSIRSKPVSLTAPNDDEILVYDAVSGFYIPEAQSGGSGDSVSIDSSAVVDPDFVSTGDVDFVDTSNTITANLNADVVAAAEIADNAIQEEHLKAVNAATDEYYLTYESTTGDFEWVAGTGGGATSEDGLESDLADTTNVLTDNDASITFDGAIDLITSANGDIDLSPNGTGETNINSPLNTQASAAPTIAFNDSDATAGDDNVTISVNCTDAGDGTEDCDLLMQQQIAGTPTDLMAANADGTGDARIVFPDSSIGADEIMATGQTNGYYLQWATGDVLQWAVGAGGAFNDASDPIVPNTTTKDLQLGDGAGTLTGKLEIGGDADQPQMVIEGYSTQTDSILIVQNDADTEVFAVDNDGTTNIGTGDGSITGSAGGVDLVLGASDVATIGDGGTTDYVQIDENGVISWNGTAGLGAGTIDALTEFADLCAGSEAIARNSGDSAWECASIGSGSGDNVEIDSVGVTDPDFQSTGDVDFVDTSNVVTANLNIDVVDASHMADADHGDVAWSSGAATVDTIALETASLTSLADDEVLVGDGAASGSFLALQNCNDTTEKLDWTGTAFSCVTDQTGGSTSWDVTDTDASPILTVDDTEQVQFIGAGTVTVVAAADSTDHDVTITGSAHTTASGITMGGDVSSTADSAQVDDVQSATTNLEAADNDTTQVASTSFVQQEINGAGGTDLSCSGGQCNVDSPVTSATTATTATLGDSATAFFSEGEIEKAYLPNVESLDTTGGTDGYHLQQTGATTYEFDWTRIRYHASDCTGLTDGEQYEPCWELDDNTLYVCETATCNAAGWAAATAAGDGVGYDTVEDNGTPETQRAILNMISGGTVTVSCTDNVDTTDCTFTGSAHDGTGTDNQNLSVTAGGADTSVIDIEDGTDVTISGGTLTNVTEAASTITIEAVATLSSYTDDLSHVEESTTVTDNADGMDITLSTYDIAVALDPSEVGNQAGDLADLVPYEDVTDGGIHHMTFTQVQTLVADGTGTDDQTAAEVAFTPDDGAEWTDTDPVNVDEALENLAPRVVANTAKTTFPGFDTVANDYSEDVTDDDLSDDLIIALSGVTTVTDGSFCQGGATNTMDCDVAPNGGTDITADLEEEAQVGTTNFGDNAADDEIPLGSAANTASWVAMANCVGENHLQYTAATNTFSCDDDDTGAVSEDSVGTTELDDGADTPLSGEYIRVDTVDQAGIEYRTDAEVLSDIGGAPNDIDYLVGTADGDLSAEIVVGTSPGGELGGTWASPTIDDTLSVADWSFTSSVNIPNGAAPTVNADGEIAHDTTADQLVYGADPTVLHPKRCETLIIENLAAADDNYPLGMKNFARTITDIGVHCAGTCTTGADISLEDRAGNAMTHTTPTHSTGTGNTTFQSVTAANTLVSGEGLRMDVDNAVSPETDTYEVTICFTADRQ